MYGFIYILPFKSNEALIEFTLFTKSILKNSEYEKVLKEYLNNKGIDSYEIYFKNSSSRNDRGHFFDIVCR